MTSPSATLRRKLQEKRGLLVPGAANALTARIIEDLGFEAVYLTGAGLTNTHWGLPDLAFMGLSDIAEHTAAIRDAVALPIIVDADTGFGNAVNVYRTVRVLERAGADAIQIEDQVFPKRCGHFAGKEVIPADEMYAKVQAACEARRDARLMIVARTDACASAGFDAAVERARRMVELGADMVFVEAPRTAEELLSLPRLAPALHVANMVIGGQTPVVARETLQAAGFAMVLYANAALQGAMAGTRNVLTELKASGALVESNPLLASFAERQNAVRKSFFDDLEARSAAAPKPSKP